MVNTKSIILSCPYSTIFTISAIFAGLSSKDGVTDKLNNKQDEVVIYSSVGAAVSVILIVAIVFAILLCKRRGTCRYGLLGTSIGATIIIIMMNMSIKTPDLTSQQFYGVLLSNSRLTELRYWSQLTDNLYV